MTQNKDLEKDGWMETTLGEVCEIIGGGTPKTTNDEYWNGDIPWLSVVDFNDNNRWVAKTEKTITEKGLKESSTKLLNAGDLIISARGTVGALAQLKIPMTFNQSCYGIKEIKGYSDKDFLFYLTKHSLLQIGRNVHGAVFDTITQETFNHIQILLPPLPEQKAIASVLSAFDDKIELLREQNKTLEEIGQVIFQDWFLPSRQAGGKYGVDDELPEGWRVGKVKDIVDIFDSKRIPLSSNQRQEKQGKYPYHGATSIMDYVDEYLFDGIYLLLAEDGSVMDQNGYPVLQYVWGKFWVNNHAHVLQGANDFSTEMLYLFFKNTKIAGIVNGAVQLKINQTNLMNLEVIIPDQETLKQFDEAIQPIFGKIRDNSEQIQFLSKLRDIVLPKLMRGEVRVKF